MTTPQHPQDPVLDVIEAFIAAEVGEHFPAMREQARDLAAALSAAGYRIIQTDPYERLTKALTTQADALRRRHEITAAAVERYRRIAEFADAYLDEECRLDHHGYCQAHGLADPPCPVGEYRALRRVVGNEQDTPA